MAFGQGRQRALIAASWPRGWLWRGVQPADLAPAVDPVRAAVLVRPQTLHDGAHVLLGAGLLTLFEPRHPSLIIREQQRSHRGYRWLGPPAPTGGVVEALDQSRRVIVTEQPRDRTVRQWLLSGVVPLPEQPELYRIAVLRQESLRDIPRTWLQAGVPPDPFVPIELDASRRVIVLRELSRHVDRGWLRSGVTPVDLIVITSVRQVFTARGEQTLFIASFEPNYFEARRE